MRLARWHRPATGAAAEHASSFRPSSPLSIPPGQALHLRRPRRGGQQPGAGREIGLRAVEASTRATRSRITSRTRGRLWTPGSAEQVEHAGRSSRICRSIAHQSRSGMCASLRSSSCRSRASEDRERVARRPPLAARGELGADGRVGLLGREPDQTRAERSAHPPVVAQQADGPASHRRRRDGRAGEGRRVVEAAADVEGPEVAQGERRVAISAEQRP